MEELIEILTETYKGLDATEEELFEIAHKLLYSKEQNEVRLNEEIVVEEELELVEVSIGDFVEFNEVIDTDLPTTLINNYYIETPSGMTRINSSIRKKKHDILEVTFEDGSTQKVAEKHLYPQYNGTDIFAKDADYVITKNGKLKIVGKEIVDHDYVYDIGIANPHLYYTADGVLSHNSALMAAQASNMLLHKTNVLYLTLEMSEEETAKRIDANVLDTDINSFGDISPEILQAKFDKASGLLGELVIKEYAAGTFSTLDLEALVHELESKKGFKPDIIFIDYLGLMKSSRITLATAGGSYGLVKAIAEECHACAKKLDLPIVTAAQLNRSAYGNVDAGLESVSDSIGLVQTADTFCLLINTDVLKENNQVILKYEKNRNTGMLNSMTLNVDYSKMRYTSFDSDTDMVTEDINLDLKKDGLDFSGFNF